MSDKKPVASIRNVVEEPWQQFPGHFGGALSKALVRPENLGSRLVDYRISTYQPMAYVRHCALHRQQRAQRPDLHRGDDAGRGSIGLPRSARRAC
jgi:hypothetical protein